MALKFVDHLRFYWALDCHQGQLKSVGCRLFLKEDFFFFNSIKDYSTINLIHFVKSVSQWLSLVKTIYSQIMIDDPTFILMNEMKAARFFSSLLISCFMFSYALDVLNVECNRERSNLKIAHFAEYARNIVREKGTFYNAFGKYKCVISQLDAEHSWIFGLWLPFVFGKYLAVWKSDRIGYSKGYERKKCFHDFNLYGVRCNWNNWIFFTKFRHHLQFTFEHEKSLILDRQQYIGGSIKRQKLCDHNKKAH